MVVAVDRRSTSVVIVDDTPDIRLLLRMAIEMTSDLEVTGEAANGLEGIALVGELQPDLVVLDLAMPVMDGFEALPRIREACPTARILVLSGFEAASLAARAIQAGADGYVQKGMAPSRIITSIRQLVDAA